MVALGVHIVASTAALGEDPEEVQVVVGQTRRGRRPRVQRREDRQQPSARHNNARHNRARHKMARHRGVPGVMSSARKAVLE